MYRGLYCPHTTKKLSSDTIYAEIASDSTGKGLSPIRLPHFLPLSVRACTLTHTLQTLLANPSCYPYFSLTGYKTEIPTTSSLGLISLSEWLTELRKTLYLLNHCLLWFIMKGYGEGNGNPLQYSCLENPMEGGAWWAAVHEVAKSWTRLSDFTFTFHFSLSCIAEGNGNPLQCSYLENPRDGGAWWAALYGVAQSRTRLERQQQQQHERL